MKRRRKKSENIANMYVPDCSVKWFLKGGAKTLACLSGKKSWSKSDVSEFNWNFFCSMVWVVSSQRIWWYCKHIDKQYVLEENCKYSAVEWYSNESSWFLNKRYKHLKWLQIVSNTQNV